MNKIKLTSEYLAPVTQNGKKIMAYSFRSAKGLTSDEIEKFITKRPDFIKKSKILGEKHNKTLKYKVTTKLNQGWRSSNWNDIDNITVYDIENDSHEDNVKDQTVSDFLVYVTISDEAWGGDDKYNDCLFYCIKDAFGGNLDTLPRQLKKPQLLKNFLGLERTQKIPVRMLEDIEAISSFSFTVSGDFNYVSKNPKPLNINLNLYQEHYKLKCNTNRSYSINCFSVAVEKKNVLSIKFTGDEIKIFDGKKSKDITFEEYQELRDFKSKTILLKCKDNETLEKKRTEFIEKADLLLKVSDKVINLYKCINLFTASVEIWRYFSKSLTEPEPIGDIEALYIDKANMGGLHYARKGYEGYAYTYDMNSMYLFYMSSKYFTVPTKQGVFKHYTNEEFDKLTFYKYGVYRCKISTNNQFFKVNKNGYYTHFDLALCKTLEIPVKIVQDDSANCILYETGRVNGDKMFGAYAEFMYNLKKKGHPVKDLINNLWGMLCQKDKRLKRGTDKNPLNITEEGEFIDEMYQEGTTTFVKTQNMNNIFKTNYARIGCFLTSYARCSFVKLCMNNSNVVKINTDSFTTTEPCNLITIGKELGEFKLEKEGKCIIHHSNYTEWLGK